VVHLAEEKVHQEDKRELACLERGKAQERKLRRVEEEEVVCCHAIQQFRQQK